MVEDHLEQRNDPVTMERFKQELRGLFEKKVRPIRH